MPAQETGKQRATRIPLDYYKKPNLLERWKTGLALAALVVTCGWLAAGLLGSDQGRVRYSRGPVASVHAAWEDNCTACHTPFAHISGNFWTSGEEASENCKKCHAGPAHHLNQQFEPACAACHHDHRGRDASLVRLADSDCTQCHKELDKSLREGEKRSFHNVVTGFDTNHPAFKSLTNDPGKVKFNHQVHLLAGMGTNFKLADIPDDADRERYVDQVVSAKNGTKVVQLQCASCHRQDSGDFGLKRDRLAELPAAAILPRRSAGAYMQPIVYENQCKACHPLTFERKKAEDPRSGYVAVRHRLQPKKVHEFLKGHYTAKTLAGKFEVFGEQVPKSPLPGKGLGKDAQKVRDFIEDRVTKAERLLFSDNTCRKCHEGAKAGGRIEPANIPGVWLEHAVFNHAAHRAVDCRSCHPRAYALLEDRTANPNASVKNTDVLINGIDNCRECHAPQTKSGGKVQGGARFDCTECHRYHNGDKPWQGLGAQERGVPDKERRDVQHFLWGLRDANNSRQTNRSSGK
jgi:hypothetical protein